MLGHTKRNVTQGKNTHKHLAGMKTISSNKDSLGLRFDSVQPRRVPALKYQAEANGKLGSLLAGLLLAMPLELANEARGEEITRAQDMKWPPVWSPGRVIVAVVALSEQKPL